MSFEGLLSKVDDLIRHMRDDGHSESYIRRVETEVRWLEKNGGDCESCESACMARRAGTESPKMKRRYNLMYGILMRFDLHGEYPDYRRTRPLFMYGSRWKLSGEFAEAIASFEEDAQRRGLGQGTIDNYARSASCFLLAMQERGLSSLAEVAEDDVLSHFADGEGGPARSRSCAGNVRAVLSSNLGPLADVKHFFLRAVRTFSLTSVSSFSFLMVSTFSLSR